MNWILAGIITAVIWFIIGAILYLNPIAKKISDKAKDAPGVKTWKKTSDMMINIFIFGTLIPSLIFAYVFSIVKPVLPDGLLMLTLSFGLMIVGMKIIPRMSDMATMSSYPKQLLIMDLINGSIASFVIALVLSYLI